MVFFDIMSYCWIIFTDVLVELAAFIFRVVEE